MKYELPEWVAEWARKAPSLKVTPPGPKSMSIIELDSEYVSEANDRLFKFVMHKASGASIMDADENIYIDFSSGVGVMNSGWSNPKVVNIIKDQAERLVHSLANDSYFEYQAKYAEYLAKKSPGGVLTKCFFGNSGAEAVETAVKLSRYHTGRSEHIAFMGAYHGRIGNSLALTSKKTYKHRHGPMSPGIYFAPYPYCYRCWFGQEYPSCGMLCLDYFEKAFLEYGGPSGDVASVFVEPIQGEGGYIVPPKEFLPRLRRICDERDILLVSDEIQAGFGRSGTLWGCENWDVVPDIITIGKAGGGGVPFGGIMSKKEVIEDWKPGSHSSTFGGNALACAAGYAQLNEIVENDMPKRAADIGEEAIKQLKEVAEKHPMIGDVRGKGLMIGVEIVKNPKTKEPYLVRTLQQICWRKGLMMIAAGMNFNVFRIAPPLVISSQQMSDGIEIFAKAITEVEREEGIK
ncbi:MAG TPA: aspartate aminotransferase family protein [Euryarchaeota archaeon]|nr:aspartate aminotransferase family protein [Euryarchaeota archaeon]